uniref:ARAD1D14696p n=1 Tax=Blastobotrys adeninivorans TaxID=409370 RepID=A0A060T8Y3_BLAAD
MMTTQGPHKLVPESQGIPNCVQQQLRHHFIPGCGYMLLSTWYKTVAVEQLKQSGNSGNSMGPHHSQHPLPALQQHPLQTSRVRELRIRGLRGISVALIYTPKTLLDAINVCTPLRPRWTFALIPPFPKNLAF